MAARWGNISTIHWTANQLINRANPMDRIMSSKGKEKKKKKSPRAHGRMTGRQREKEDNPFSWNFCSKTIELIVLVVYWRMKLLLSLGKVMYPYTRRLIVEKQCLGVSVVFGYKLWPTITTEGVQSVSHSCIRLCVISAPFHRSRSLSLFPSVYLSLYAPLEIICATLLRSCSAIDSPRCDFEGFRRPW